MIAPGIFIAPDASLQDVDDPASTLGLQTYSGHQARKGFASLLGKNKIFDSIAGVVDKLDLVYEDQCSSQYYFDLIGTLRDLNGQFNRVVEVGVFMGGATSYFAGAMSHFDFDLDLVDISASFLRFSYERVRRQFPNAVGRIRLFHGDVPSYVRHVMMEEAATNYIIHHDGAHDFNQVVKDMASLFYVRDKLHAVIAQDTHLRGTIEQMNFVDMALFAVFGTDLQCAPIGAVFHGDTVMTRPNIYQGNYFMPGVAEGVVIPMASNRFRYPHPALSMDDFLPVAHRKDEAA